MSNTEYGCWKKKTKREEFLGIMDKFIPWDEWVGIIRPYYPAGERGRPPIGLKIMLRMYLLKCWFNLSDEGVEDAILINAPSSTKNREKERDPEMHQTKKGNQCHFGMKCHTGVDAGSGFVHTVEATAANVHDVTVVAKLMTKLSIGTAPIWDWKSGKKSNRIPSFPPPNIASTAVRAGCLRFPTTPSTGDGTSRTANSLYAARWNTLTEL